MGQNNPMVLLLISLLMIAQGSALFCQNSSMQEVKKLKNELQSQQPDEQARTLLLLCKHYLTYSSDSAFFCAEEALKISIKTGNDTLKGRSYMNLGYCYMLEGKDSMSLRSYLTATEIFQRINDSANLAWNYVQLGQYYYYKSDYKTAYAFYSKSLKLYIDLNNPKLYSYAIIVMNEISYIYSDQKNFDRALFYLFTALKISEAFNDEGLGTSSLFTSIGNIYYDWKQYDKALEYFIKSYEINKKIDDKRTLAYSMNDVGRVYSEKGLYDTSFYYHKKAAELFQEVNDNIGISASNAYLGNYYRIKKNYNVALMYFKRALNKCEKNPSMVSQLLYEIGRAYYNMNITDKALENSMKSLAIAQGVKYKEYIYQNYLLISDIYSAKDNCSLAFTNYKNYTALKDSIFNMQSHSQISELEKKYKTDQMEKNLQIQEKTVEIQKVNIRRQKIFRNSLLIVVSLIAILSVVVFRSYRQKRKGNLIIAEEKRKSDKLLMNILPEETAEELKREGFVKTRYYENVSVLFTDFKGFTAISENMSPEKLVAELDYCFTEYDVIMEKYNIEKIKTIGDSYMCAGGLPVPNTTHPVDIVNCGLEICKFMEEYKQKRIAANEKYFEVRIGIHTGPVISGIVGTKKFAYDIWGDTVNTASRMESSGVLGAVNISGSTYEFVKEYFKCAYRGKVEAKSKGLIDMYLVECCKGKDKNSEG